MPLSIGPIENSCLLSRYEAEYLFTADCFQERLGTGKFVRVLLVLLPELPDLIQTVEFDWRQRPFAFNELGLVQQPLTLGVRGDRDQKVEFVVRLLGCLLRWCCCLPDWLLRRQRVAKYERQSNSRLKNGAEPLDSNLQSLHD
ncbi:MAG: hypothetical protein HY000_06010 [Planctomycetes bacterium]|nr:hypothetical protein [Planctomycetota bacterium]